MKKETQLLVDKIIEGLQDKKGHDIVVADLSEIGDTVCQAFVICTGNSPSQVNTLAGSMSERVQKDLNIKASAADGLRHCQWVAADYSDVIVHIFLPETRDFYDIEHLWADAKLNYIEDLD